MFSTLKNESPTHLRLAQNELHMPLSVVSIIRGVDDPNANCIELRSLRRLVSIRWSRSWFFCRMYCRRSLSASCIARLRSSTCERRSFSLRRRSSMRRRRSSSRCSRNFCVASACAFSSSSFRCRSSFWRSLICFIRSSRSFCRSKMGDKLREVLILGIVSYVLNNVEYTKELHAAVIGNFVKSCKISKTAKTHSELIYNT